MSKMWIERLIYDDQPKNAPEVALALGLADGVLAAARQVLGAAWAVGSIDADLVHQALIDLLHAAIDASQHDGLNPRNGDGRQGEP
jgi:hypothetical protein